MKVAFVVPDVVLSGGINVVMHHASSMAGRPGWEVAIVVTAARSAQVWPYPGLDRVEVMSVDESTDRHFDLAIATWWGTVRSLPLVPADHYAYFVQSLEDRFPLRTQIRDIQLAGSTYHLGLPVITEATWIHELLKAQSPEVPCFLVRNGIDKAIFASPDSVEPRVDGPLRILIEGSRHAPFKGVEDALDATSRMTTERHVTLVAIDDQSPHRHADRVEGPMPQAELAKLYAETDVLLKLPRVEGMFGPPLEAMHLGATCIVTPVTGHDMYVRHGWNGMVTSWDDPVGTASLLDLLNDDRRLLHRLRTNALATAQGWPGWDEQTNRFAFVVHELCARPPSMERATLAAMVRHLWRWPDARAVVSFEHRADLVRIRSELHELDRSRWLRGLALLELPVRLRRPGLGSVRARIAHIADSLDELTEDAESGSG